MYRTRRASREDISRELEALPLEEKVAIGIGRYLVVNRVFARGTLDQKEACRRFLRELLPLLRRLDVMPEYWDDVNKP